jgi:asparagine synthase (glutamine-hydrolysing)
VTRILWNSVVADTPGTGFLGERENGRVSGDLPESWVVQLDGWLSPRGSADVPSDLGVECLQRALEGSLPQALTSLVGEYAFVAWNRQTSCLVAARDPLATRPLFWARTADGVVVGSRAADVIAQPGVVAQPDEGAIAELISERPATPTATVWSGVQRVPGGQAMLFDARRSSVRWVRFWEPSADIAVQSPGDALREAVETSVRRRARTGERVACELSGGFDSSTILGVARGLGIEIAPYSNVYPGWDCDESALIEESLRHHGLSGRLLHVAPPSIEQRRACVRAHGLIGDYVLGDEGPRRAAAADGCGVILSGDFGDEVLGGTGLGDADALVRYRLQGLTRLATGPRRRQLAAQAYRQRLRWMVGPRVRRHWQKALPAWVPLDLAKRVSLYDRLAEADGILRDGSPSFRSRMTTFEGFWTQSRSDLADVDIAAQADLRTPFGDLELVELSLRIPESVKSVDGDRRAMHRRAFADVLAPSIRDRTGKAEFSAVIHAHLAAGPDLLAGRPAVVDLGWVDPVGLVQLREEVAAARTTMAFTRGLWAYATLNELELWAQEWVM